MKSYNLRSRAKKIIRFSIRKRRGKIGLSIEWCYIPNIKDYKWLDISLVILCISINIKLHWKVKEIVEDN